MPFLRERILGGLWGAVVGDALGVPVEFLSREEVRANPVTDMRGFGTHKQPAGTWSDDSSLILCTTDSLLHGFDTEDMARRFVEWQSRGLWTPHGEAFDVGLATSEALTRIESGTPAEEAGGRDESSNGNGSLMRILPVVLCGAESPMEDLLDAVHRVSSITHRHPRSLMACGYYALFVRAMCSGLPAFEAYRKTGMEFRRLYAEDEWLEQMDHFKRILSGDLPQITEDEIKSGGYVIHTLEASLLCLLNTRKFEECVLRAVNLGGDTDTTGCVAGGAAGVLYGMEAIPIRWRKQLARQADMNELFQSFSEALEAMP